MERRQGVGPPTTGQEDAGAGTAPESAAGTAPETAAPSIGRLAGRGLRWGVAGTLLTRAGSFLMGLVMARLLTPEDFGVYAVALAAMTILMTVKDLGVMAAVVQWRGGLEEVTPTATVLSFVSAIGLYAVFFAGAPYFAALAGAEEAAPVVRLLTAVILVEGFTAVRSAVLMRRFEQDKITMAIGAGFLANGTIAITLAAQGAGAFSFAWGQVTAAVIAGTIMFRQARLPLRLGFDRDVARRLLRFGIPSAAAIGIETMLLNAGYIVVGDIMGPIWLGYFLLAFNVSSWVPGVIGAAVRYVSVPGFSRLSEHDPAAFAEGVRRSSTALLATVLPVAMVMVALSHPLIALLYGERWDSSAGVLRFLALAMVTRMLTAFALDVLTGQGNTRAGMWMNVGHGVLLIPMLIAGTRLDGIRGAAIGQALAGVLVALPIAAFMLRRCGVPIRPIAASMLRPLAAFGCGLAVTAGVNWLTPGPALAELVLGAGAGLIVYVALVVPRQRLREVAGQVADRLGRRSRLTRE
ncbi:oligosaccharide flippase family protein [Planomonospora corallina]|uniref:Oligosaccharide flippase family protein n=1 Tax=Planomonospora corallina TaxID=1806052 RepID=A0ABV8I3W0_9ACTN